MISMNLCMATAASHALSPPDHARPFAPMRSLLEQAADKLRARADANISTLNGLSLVGPSDAHLIPDGLHPHAEGIKTMARRFLEDALAGWAQG